MIQVNVSVALLSDAEGCYLCPWNARWGMFTLPMSRLHSGRMVRESAMDAAHRAGAEAAGAPVEFVLGTLAYPPLTIEGVSGRQQARKCYHYHVFHVGPHPRFARSWRPVGSHVWLSVEEANDPTYSPLSWTVSSILNRVNRARTAPLRVARASLALIGRSGESEPLWLSGWNRSWQGYHFIGGRLGPRETHRDCLRRKVAEELGLEPDVDFQIGNRASRVEYTTTSRRTGDLTDYEMELFRVQFTSDRAPGLVMADPNHRWLSAGEVRTGVAADNRGVSDTMSRLLNEAGWPAN